MMMYIVMQSRKKQTGYAHEITLFLCFVITFCSIPLELQSAYKTLQ